MSQKISFWKKHGVDDLDSALFSFFVWSVLSVGLLMGDALLSGFNPFMPQEWPFVWERHAGSLLFSCMIIFSLGSIVLSAFVRLAIIRLFEIFRAR